MQKVRLIDANALAESDMAKLIDEYLYNQCNLTVGLAAALMPEIEAEPVRHGRWMQRGNGEYHCTNCGREEKFIFQKIYCPRCGARMDATDTNVGGKGGETE